VIDYSRVPLIR